jgi:hypothetical protein
MSVRPLVCLLAHGEAGAAPSDGGAAARLARAASALAPEIDFAAVTLGEAGDLPRRLRAEAARPVVLGLPLLFSDGFTFDKLSARFAEHGRAVLDPIGLWPEFATGLDQRLGSEPQTVLLIAHGGGPRGRSAQAAHALAQRLARPGRTLACGFLEEAPFASDLARGLTGRWSALGLFLGAGRHGGEDVAAVLAAASEPPADVVLAGAWDALPQLIAARVRRQLAGVSWPHS